MIHTAALVIAAASAGFSNLTLANAQQAAIQRSPDVAAASARVTENEAALAAARGTFGPALTASYAQSPQAGPNGGTITQRFTTIGAQTTLGDLINYSPVVAQAAANLRSAQFDLATAQHGEQIRLIGLYYDALRAVATAQTRTDAVHAAQEDRRAAAIRFGAGDAPRLDVVRADVALARATADLENAHAVESNALEALAIETGEPVAAMGPASASQDVYGTTLPQTPDAAVARALVRRPELASAQSAVDAQAAAVRAAERSILPIVTVSGGYTRGTDSGIRVAGPSASAQLTFPLSNGASARARVERAKLEQAQAHFNLVQRQISVEVAAAMRTYAANGRALQAAQEARRQADAELQAVTTGYRSGASSSLEVTAARQTYVQALLDELTAQYAQAQARATLELLLGP